MVTDRGVVGRAELKLKGAVEAFSYDFRGKVVLDIGSSTGGFTELALRMGAVRVIAIEKGTKQMKAPLRFDPKIDLYEKTDFLEVGSLPGRTTSSETVVRSRGVSNTASLRSSSHPRISFQLVSSGENLATLRVSNLSRTSSEITSFQDSLSNDIDLSQVQTVVADVSFVSLRKILAHAKKIVPRKADYLVMLKPQFEAFPDQLVNGVVKNEKMRREIIKRFEQWLMRNGFLIVKKRDNEVVGKVGGNRERFYWLKRV